MSAVNGALTPTQQVEPAPSPVTAKRKRYDSTPSIFDIPLPLGELSSASSEHAAKRKKLSTPSSKTITISAKLKDHAYSSVAELASDLGVAFSTVTTEESKNSSQDGADAGHDNSGPYESVDTSKVLALKKVLQGILRHDEHRGVLKTNHEPAQSHETNGVKPEVNGTADEVELTEDTENAQDGRTVLTLFANANGPRQLFSSLQNPVKVGSKETVGMDTRVDVSVPLQEDGLPNLLSTTKVLPVSDEDGSDGTTRVATFGELFAPPATVPQLNPPRPAKQMTTRGSTITWGHHDTQSRGTKRPYSVYATEKLPTGQWLGYGGVDASHEGVEKRRRRDRALSTGDVKAKPSKEALSALQQVRDEAMFRSAYSSFAPCRDNSAGIVPEELKSRVWWHKVGEQKFKEATAIDPALLDDFSAAGQANGVAEDLDDEALKQTVANWTPEAMDAVDAPGVSQPGEKDSDELLNEISNLIETLYSYQRIRHASLSSGARTPAGSPTTLTGTPTTPSEAETEVYKTLQMQLMLIVQSLPPYLVAKLNGDRLAELNIPRTLVTDAKDYRGVLEEDQVSRIARQAALSAAAGSVSSARPGSGSSHGHYPGSGQYSRQAVPPPISTSRHHSSQSYYPQQQAPSRSSSIYNRPSSSQSYGPNASSYYSRPSSAQQYNQPSPRQSYTHTGSQQYYPQTTPRPPAPHTSNSGSYGTPTTTTQPSSYYPATAPGQHAQYRGYQPPGSAAPHTPLFGSSYQHPAAPSPSASTHHANSPLKATPAAIAQQQLAQQMRPSSASYGTSGAGAPSQHSPPAAQAAPAAQLKS